MYFEFSLCHGTRAREFGRREGRAGARYPHIKTGHRDGEQPYTTEDLEVKLRGREKMGGKPRYDMPTEEQEAQS